MRKENSMPILERSGKIRKGTIIELVPKVAGNLRKADMKKCRATVEKPSGGRDFITSHLDRQSYSPTSLLDELCNHFPAIKCVKGVCNNWRIVDHRKSLRAEAG